MKDENVCSSFRAGRLVTKSSGCKSELTLLGQFTAKNTKYGILEGLVGVLVFGF